jgi:hypothetical protein
MQISQSLEKLTAMTWSAPSTGGDLTPLLGSVEPAMIIRFGSNLGKSESFTKNGDTLSQRHQVSTVSTFDFVDRFNDLLPCMFELIPKSLDFSLELHHPTDTFKIHSRIDEF